MENRTAWKESPRRGFLSVDAWRTGAEPGDRILFLQRGGNADHPFYRGEGDHSGGLRFPAERLCRFFRTGREKAFLSQAGSGGAGSRYHSSCARRRIRKFYRNFFRRALCHRKRGPSYGVWNNKGQGSVSLGRKSESLSETGRAASAGI